MIVARAWPESDRPPGRPHIIDGWPRITVDLFDYRGLADLGDDVIVLDWDIAPSQADVLTLAAHAAEAPGKVLAAPYVLYPPFRPEPVWSVGMLGDAAGREWRPAAEGTERVHTCGLGMTYLPRRLLLKYTEDLPGHPLTDTAFSYWHYRRVEEFMRVDWSVRPVHLHYPEAEAGKIEPAAIEREDGLPHAGHRRAAADPGEVRRRARHRAHGGAAHG